MLTRLVLLTALLATGCTRSSTPAPVRVAAASDLTDAFDELGRRFQTEAGTTVSFTFGSSGLLAKQLTEGAPFDVFASANAAFVAEAVQAGVCDGSTVRPFARGRVVLWSRSGEVTLERLTSPETKRIAIANPEHAPYGKAAREALEHLGLWAAVEARVVYAENVRQALQLAETGNVEFAFVALANVAQRDGGSALIIEERLHTPIEQVAVVCTGGKQPAGGRRFWERLFTEDSRSLLGRYGLGGGTTQGPPSTPASGPASGSTEGAGVKGGGS